MKLENSDENFSESETEERMRAALRGARIAGHKPMKPKETATTKKRALKNTSEKKPGK